MLRNAKTAVLAAAAALVLTSVGLPATGASAQTPPPNRPTPNPRPTEPGRPDQPGKPPHAGKPTPAPTPSEEPPLPDVVVRAGYGEADATWHVGAGSGQYSGKNPDQTNVLSGGDVDPHAHSTAQRDSYGVHSRLTYRAIAVEDEAGDHVVFVKSDLYLAQDYLLRRAAQILADQGSEITYDEIMHMASHNHSSPYYTTPSWGVWLFQDAFDLRAFEYHARAMAEAIRAAEVALVPARMGATTVEHLIYKGQIQRAGLGHDGTPVGYPADFGDFGLVVVRFDDMTDPRDPQPLASLINWGQHPESLDGYDLITSDFIGPLERFVERATGAPLVFGQGDVGSAEAGPGRPDQVPNEIPKRWSHFGHANTERGAWFLARDVIAAWEQIGAGDADVPFSVDFDVAAGNAFIPGPVSHPYPSVSNCRTHQTAEGNPGAPIVGLPDCARAGSNHDESNMLFENLKAHGIPVPEHYDAPAFGAVEENMRLKLQAFRMGEVLFASCACEVQVDLVLNFESRADKAQGNIWDGYDWRERLGCAQNPDETWTCKDPRNENNSITFSNDAYERMVAQVHNDAKGWDAPENAVHANAEPSNPEDIWGNFTKEELPEDLGYTLPVMVGHAGDYNGYTVSYREYMAYDTYRKALTSYGPHTADYMSTRLVRLAGELKGGPALEAEVNDAQGQADEARQHAAATALGRAAEHAYDAWIAALPDDAGPAEALTQPESIRRFDAATFMWRGGSNAVDNPTVRVERLTEGGWETFADQSGEVQTTLRFPKGMDGLIDTYTGSQEWLWTANFEAFDSLPAAIGNTPVGEYRFVATGTIRSGGQDVGYEIVSDPFEVLHWDGIRVEDLRAEEDGSVSFVVPEIRYPETYDSDIPYIQRRQRSNDNLARNYCITCSFRPWAFTGEVAEAVVTVERADGTTEQVTAHLQDGRWVAPTNLQAGDRAFVAEGGVRDRNGEYNGEATDAVER